MDGIDLAQGCLKTCAWCLLDIYWIHSDFAIKGGLENSTELMVASKCFLPPNRTLVFTEKKKKSNIIAETILLIKIGSVQLHLIH